MHRKTKNVFISILLKLSDFIQYVRRMSFNTNLLCISLYARARFLITILLNFRCPQCHVPIGESTRLSIDPQAATPNSNVGEESMYVDDLPDYALPHQLNESSIQEPDPAPEDDTEEEPLTYHRVESSSQRNKDRLIDSRGYTYTVLRRKVSTVTAWRCAVRNKSVYCKATVLQNGENYTAGRNQHIHPPCAGALDAAKVIHAVKQKSKENLFTSAAAIVDEVMREELDQEKPIDALPKPINLTRTANRTRQKLRPEDPTTMDFDLCEEFIPEQFLRADVTVGKNSDARRHIIFASNDQLQLLSQAKEWYVDATFKVVRQPFTQLFTVNAFIRSGECSKQIPLVFCVMSGKRKKDYKKVLQEILKMLPTKPRVKTIIGDFERAIWNALTAVYPDVQLKGCLFHWTQALWRKTQELGLQRAYSEDRGTHKFIRKLMALPFLPSEHIQPLFDKMVERATSQQLTELVTYVESTWITSEMWPPATWSVFMRSTRTNNDIEGWHFRLNQRAQKGNLPFYMLLTLLTQEAAHVNLQVRLVSEKKLQRIQRSKSRQMQGTIFKLWEEYNDKNKSASQLLKSCAALHGPILE